jgi:hypothetical protein
LINLGPVWTEVIGRPEGQLRDRLSKILLKFFPDLSCVRMVVLYCPDSHTLAARNFHINASRVRTKGIVIRMVDQMQAIFISIARASGPRRLAFERLDFECDTCLMNECVWTGIHIIRTVAAIFPYLCFERKSHSLSNTECLPDVLLKRPDRCKLEQFEASRHRGRSRRMILWIVGGPDGISRRLDGCKGSNFFLLV